MASFFGHEEKLTCGGFSPDGRVLVTGSEDKSIRVWKPSTGEQVKKISGYGFHEGIVICMDFHQSQSILVSGSDDSTACLVNYETGKVKKIFFTLQVLSRTQVDQDFSIESVVFTPLLELFAVGSQSPIIKLYDIQKLSIRSKF